VNYTRLLLLRTVHTGAKNAKGAGLRDSPLYLPLAAWLDRASLGGPSGTDLALRSRMR
jgi:hypothetical protein